MKTSDKELDDLFTSKLNDFEVEPAANLWQNISEELNRKPKRKSIIPVLRIAAGIVVVLSVGLLFLRKQDPVKIQLSKKTAKVELQKQDPGKNQIKKLDDKNSMLLLSAKNKVVKTALPESSKRNVAAAEHIVVQKLENELVSTQTLSQNRTVAAVEILEDNPIQSQVTLVPDASISLKPQFDNEISQKPIVKPQVIVIASNTSKAKHKRIRSIGDVVNLVMAKVDKREDKLIQFSDTDDGDESNVTGINLGFVSLKKEK